MEAKKYRVGNLVIVDNDLRSENGYIHEITEVRALDCQVQLKNLDIIYGQMYKFIKPMKVSSLPTKKYEIDFGTHLRCGINVTNNELNILGAMDGWGDGVSKDVVVIKQI